MYADWGESAARAKLASDFIAQHVRACNTYGHGLQQFPRQATFVEDTVMTTTNIHPFALATCAALLIGIAAPAAGQRTPPTIQPIPEPSIDEAPRVQPTLREPAQQSDLNLKPAVPTRSVISPARPQPTYRPAPQSLLPPGDEPQGETPQQLAATQQEREWLIAYLISHEGYNIHQIDQIEARLDKMSPTLIGSLVMLYKQKHDRALQREAAVQAMRQNMVAADESQLRRNQSALNRVNSDENAAAQHEQGVLDQQRQQTTQGYFQNQPYRTMPYYGGGYGMGYPSYFPAYGY